VPSTDTTATRATATATPPSVGQTLATRDGAEPTGAADDGGRTQIADTVVSKIAGLAAREISGVHALGGGTARAFGALRERIPGASSNVSQGVAVEVGQRQTAIDLDIVVEYGVAIAELARAIRRNVVTALERMTGLEVVEVNVSVTDVHIPALDDADTAAPAQPARVA
jgi:uncharacterized alkaline shock family protein YloU